MQILGPALAGSNVFVEARLIPTSLAGRGGALTGQRVLRFLRDTLRQRSDTHVTTFFDLYGLPSDFPGVAASSLDPVDRATAVEASLHAAVVRVARCRPDRFLPHIQPYEFEALLFSDTSHFAREQREWEQPAEELAAARRRATSPEHINEGPTPIRRRGSSDSPATARFAMVRPLRSASGWTAFGASVRTSVSGSPGWKPYRSWGSQCRS